MTKGKIKNSSIPAISVLMSVYNGEKYLKETIDSILNQNFTDFEFIIVNDGSEDNSLKIMKDYLKKDSRIVIINNLKNIGFIKSLNKGLKIAKGKYIARMDSDDISLSERFFIQYEYLESHPDIFLVGSYAINMDESGVKISLFKPPLSPDKIRVKLEETNCLYHNTIMFRNSGRLFYRLKMKYVEDYDFYTRLITEGKKLANIPKFLVKYRRLSSSASFGNRGYQKLFGKKARDFFMQRLITGKDDYESFDPNDILGIDINTSNNPDVLMARIISTFATNELDKTRILIYRYIKSNPFNPMLGLYYILTFFPKKILINIKRLINFCMGKY